MSTILVNTLTGTSTAGSIAVTGEGNSTTTNLQQGLAKAWVKFGNDAQPDDSFNIASGTDVGTGQWRFAKTNSMSSTDYTAVGANGNTISSWNTGAIGNAIESTANHTQSKYNNQSSSFQDFSGYGMHNVHGDLA